MTITKTTTRITKPATSSSTSRIPSRHNPYPKTNSATVTPFQERVYSLLVQIPAGRVSTYALMSKALNSSPRAVGGALRNNPFAPEVPCHRVIAADGFVGGFKVSRWFYFVVMVPGWVMACA
jgi:O-6-methylguanine DNA methyltransferase